MREFTQKLVAWYVENSRDLPWRAFNDPYIIWISEVILQQTRVKQGLPYFNKFTEKFKSVEELAVAGEEEVLQLWQGLGYYSRARNMHKCAKKVAFEFGGVFPDNYRDLQKLPGIGSYTAAAIASFCFGESVPVIDGNVLRVVSRYVGISSPINSREGYQEVSRFVNEAIKGQDPANFNQSMMELGALVCTPKATQCIVCPVSEGCYANRRGKVSQLPVKIKKTKVRQRYFNYLVWSRSVELPLVKRQGPGIWQHLYEFPLIETRQSRILKGADLMGTFTHILSHQRIEAKLWKVNEIGDFISENKRIFEANIDDIGTKYPVHQLMKKMYQLWQESIK